MPKRKTVSAPIPQAGKLNEIQLRWWRDRPPRTAVNTAAVSCPCTQVTPEAMAAIDTWVQEEVPKGGAFLSVRLEVAKDGVSVDGTAERWTIKSIETFDATKKLGLVLQPGGILDVKDKL